MMGKIVGKYDMEKTVVLPEIEEFLKTSVHANTKPDAQGRAGNYRVKVKNAAGKEGDVYFDHREAAHRPEGNVYGFWKGNVRMAKEELDALQEVRFYRDTVKGILALYNYPEGQQRLEGSEQPGAAKSAQADAEPSRNMSSGAEQAPPKSTAQPEANKGSGGTCEKCEVKDEKAPPVDVAHQEHYMRLPMQPIEVMLLCVPPVELVGFMKCNILKYRMRCKDAKDEAKAKQYEAWLEEYQRTGRIAQFDRRAKQ
jgi:hypothetical protein